MCMHVYLCASEYLCLRISFINKIDNKAKRLHLYIYIYFINSLFYNY